MPRYGWGGQCGCDCAGPRWTSNANRDELVEELSDYKANLESEIIALEHRIETLKEQNAGNGA